MRPFLVPKKPGSVDGAFGMLRHRARPVNAEEEAAAVRAYFGQRHGPQAGWQAVISIEAR